MLLLMAYISIPAVTAAGGFALTASPFCKRPKGTKTLRPSVRPLAWARRSFAPAFIWGHRLRSASLRPPLDVCGFAARRYAPPPQMNASTQPPEGAGRSRAGELTLGLMSGEERSVYTEPLVGARLAREGVLTANHLFQQTRQCRTAGHKKGANLTERASLSQPCISCPVPSMPARTGRPTRPLSRAGSGPRPAGWFSRCRLAGRFYWRPWCPPHPRTGRGWWRPAG
jgi:hypothetical protein